MDLTDELEVAAPNFMGTECLDCRLHVPWMSGKPRLMPAVYVQWGLMVYTS